MFLFFEHLFRKCIYNYNCDRQQKWICAQVPWESAEEDSDGRSRNNIQLSGRLAPGHCSDYHMVSSCHRYVWFGGLQELFRWEPEGIAFKCAETALSSCSLVSHHLFLAWELKYPWMCWKSPQSVSSFLLPPVPFLGILFLLIQKWNWYLYFCGWVKT